MQTTETGDDFIPIPLVSAELFNQTECPGPGLAPWCSRPTTGSCR